uniref:Uncharacterized protein n=1 Tax=Arundo donax TaxID=35708 RepID=A0A0A9DK43_ARUDO
MNCLSSPRLPRVMDSTVTSTAPRGTAGLYRSSFAYSARR